MMKENRKLNACLSLETRNDFLTGSTYLEEVDEKKLFALCRSKNVLQTTKTWWEDVQIKWSALYVGEMPNEQNFCKNLLEKLVKRGDKFYLETRYFSQKGYGRVYPNKCESLGIMRREVRHFLCKDL